MIVWWNSGTVAEWCDIIGWNSGTVADWCDIIGVEQWNSGTVADWCEIIVVEQWNSGRVKVIVWWNSGTVAEWCDIIGVEQYTNRSIRDDVLTKAIYISNITRKSKHSSGTVFSSVGCLIKFYRNYPRQDCNSQSEVESN